MPYTDPQYNVDQIIPLREQTGGGATTAYAQYKTYRKTRVLGARCKVVVAGTNAGHGLSLLAGAAGTSSIGTVSIGTESADVWFDFTVTETDLDAGDIIALKTLVDATGKNEIYLRVRDLPE